MGMYDIIHVDYSLGEGIEVNRFQTHSMDCGMQEYRIHADGRLLKLVREIVWEHEPGKTAKGYEDTCYHGDLYIHAKGGLEFRVRFTDGVVTHVKKTGGG